MDVVISEHDLNYDLDNQSQHLSNSSHDKVMHSAVIDDIASVIGWIYFTAWTLSFYPQVFSNWKRKSVVGLSFDFVLFNMIGFIAYCCFNVGLYWIPSVKAEYFKEHKDGVSPVQINDVFFAIHAVAITLVVIIQCFIYERGTQKISVWSKVLVGFIFLYVIITLILTLSGEMIWLDFLYNFSYIKLVVTCLKYTPQAYLNFKRKSTLGWSIGNVLLDFIGGWLSIIQMFLLAYNGDDWDSIFGNVTKFGLGLVTIVFDSLFIFQHYVLYRGKGTYSVLKDYEIAVTSEHPTGRGSSPYTAPLLKKEDLKISSPWLDKTVQSGH
ncbi:cystinosin-like isoform X1 [Biomphalaria glabrata]|uniref:Cystinosin homolog n=2 Tax=Biomphalaria glabrata TaxID=6526 RepID=A0A9W3AFG9_BIOGL|nr:cystinosin-like isoform X1 [Biomphalaria glabrata]